MGLGMGEIAYRKYVVKRSMEIFTIFEYTDAYPRTFLADKYAVIKDPGKMISAFFDPKTDLRNTLLLEENPDIKIDDIKEHLDIIKKRNV